MSTALLTPEALEEWFGRIVAANDPVAPFAKWAAVHPGFASDLQTAIRRARAYRKEIAGIVYFIAGADLVKIGKTMEITERVRALQGMSPVPLRIVGHVLGYTATEALLHKRFAKQRAHGEWFRFDDEIRAYIDENNGRPILAMSDDPECAEVLARVGRVLDVMRDLYGDPPCGAAT